MKKLAVRVVFGILAAAYVASHLVGHAHAQVRSASAPTRRWFRRPASSPTGCNWINVQQQDFYRSLTGALKAMRDDGGKLWLIVGLSFAYGIFHAAGPGHGKAVISSYMLANEVALRRGIMLSFVSAFLQALTAIVVMTLVFLVLRGTSISMTDATSVPGDRELRADHALRRLAAVAQGRAAGAGPAAARRPAHSLSAAPCARTATRMVMPTSHAHSHSHASCARPRIRAQPCGRAKSATPAAMPCARSGAAVGRPFGWRTAWSAIVAVGLRPCSGALIVLSFAFLNGLWVGGILSVFAMALGTAITVSTLATLAVTAKNWAVAYAGDGRTGNRVHAAIEIGGAAFVFLLGLLLLSASLAG